MLNIELIIKIRAQITQLEAEKNRILAQRKTNAQKGVWSDFTQNFSQLFYDEATIKQQKINALWRLISAVKSSDRAQYQKLYFELINKKNSHVFSGLNNNTEKLFEDVALFFIDQVKVNQVAQSYENFYRL